MNKFKLLGIFLFSLATALAFSAGCGHHHRRHHLYNVAAIDSSTNPRAGDTVIIIQSPPAYDFDVLLEELLAALENFEINTNVNVDVVIEVLPPSDDEPSATCDDGKLILAPGLLKKLPSLYHALCEHYGLKCNPALCDKFPKPCDNEDD